jgi:hypothetical protein
MVRGAVRCTGRRRNVGAAMMADPQRAASDRLYAAVVASRRIGGDGPLCEVLERIADETGRAVLRYAAQVLRGKMTLGRAEIDDRRALQRISAWPAEHKSDAVGIVAREMAGPGATDEQVQANAQRLRRKRRKINERKGFRSPSRRSIEGP